MQDKVRQIDQTQENIITEYVETEEGEGISIIPLTEKTKKMDDEKYLLAD